MRVRGKTKEIRIYTRASRPGTIKVLSTGFAFSPWPSGKCARLFPRSEGTRSLVTTGGRTRQGGRVIRAEENLCSSISGEKLPMNRWSGGEGRSRQRGRDINHRFSF